MNKIIERKINDFDENNPETDFWTDSKNVYYRFHCLKKMNVNHFVYDSVWEKMTNIVVAGKFY